VRKDFEFESRSDGDDDDNDDDDDSVIHNKDWTRGIVIVIVIVHPVGIDLISLFHKSTRYIPYGAFADTIVVVVVRYDQAVDEGSVVSQDTTM